MAVVTRDLARFLKPPEPAWYTELSPFVLFAGGCSVIELAVVVALNNPYHQTALTSHAFPLLPALGKPLVVRAMERLYRAGIRRYVVILDVSAGSVASYLTASWMPNVSVEFVVLEHHESLTRTLSELCHRHPEPFLLCGYDTFVHPNHPERLLRQAEGEGVQAVLTVAPVLLNRTPDAGAQRWWANGAIFEDALIAPTGALHVANLAVFGQGMVDYLANATVKTGVLSNHLSDIFVRYIRSGGTVTAAETSWMLQVQSDLDLLAVNKLLMDEGVDTHILTDLASSVQIVPPVRIDPRVSIGQGAKIGPRVYLEAGCSVGHHAQLSHTVVLAQSVVPANSQIHETLVYPQGRLVAG